MKKSFLALLCASFLLVGCGGGSKGSEEASSNQSQSQQQSSEQSQEQSSEKSQEASSEASQEQSQEESGEESHETSEESQEESQEESGEESSEEESGDVPVIPTEEGKTTFFFELAEESLAIPEYAGFFLTGAFCGWATAVDAVVELTLLDGTDNIYYGMWEGEPTEFSYQLTVGYKADAGAPTSGVDWTFKSLECQAYEYGTDPQFEVADGVAALGQHTWDAMPADPAASAIHNLTIEIPFETAVPEYVDIHLAGSSPFSWTLGEETILTPNDDRTVFSVTVDTIIGNVYEIKVLANYNDEAPGWDHVVLDDGAGNNYSLTVKKTWGDNHTLNLAEDAWLEDEVFKINWDEFMPAKSGAKVDVTLEVNFDAALTLEHLYVIGNFTSWGAEELATEDNVKYTYVVGKLDVGYEMQFGICADDGWHTALKLGGENNVAVVGEEDLTVVLNVAEGGAAFFNENGGKVDGWVSFEYGDITDSTGTTYYELPAPNPMAAIYEAAAGDEVTFVGQILMAYGNATNEYFVANGEYAVDVYGTALPEGVTVGDVVEVSGKVDIYKGLYEIKNATYTLSEEEVAPVQGIFFDENTCRKENLNRPVMVMGMVKEGKAIDGTSHVTVTITVDEGLEANIYIKANKGFDYAGLNDLLGTTGNVVRIAGFLSIFDSAATVDYATSTGYQVVNPFIVPENVDL